MSDSEFEKNFGLWFLFLQNTRSSLTQMFWKIGVLKNFVLFTGMHLCWILFLIKLPWRPVTLLKRDSYTVFLWNVWNFKNFLYRTPLLTISVKFLYFTEHFETLQSGMEMFWHELYFQKQSPGGILFKRGLLQNFAKFSEKNDCQSLFYLIKLEASSLQLY